MRVIEKRFRDQLRRSRIALAFILVPMMPLAYSLAGFTDSFLRLAYIVLGFSLIIFLHELGHFLVARACSVKCLAFSIGIGPRMLGWRKGAGVSFGNDPFDPETKKMEPSKKGGKTSGEKEDERYALKELEEGKVVVQSEKGPVAIEPDTKNLTGDILGTPQTAPHHHPAGHAVQSDLPTVAEIPPHPRNVGDTDYRVSWLPLGGYVRMLGQDDMDPTKVSDDPRAFNNRPIWQRMCIVSAGVIMNLIFAAVCFSIIFSPGIGVDFPPAIIGQVAYNSPAWNAEGGGLEMGDRILSMDGEFHRGFLEFTDVAMKCALATGTEPIIFRVRPYNTTGDHDRDVKITPVHNDATGFLSIGAESEASLLINGTGAEYLEGAKDSDKVRMLSMFDKNKDELAKIRKGDEIVAVDGVDVHGDYIAFFRYMQSQHGQAVKLTLHDKNGKLPPHEITLIPQLLPILGVNEYPMVLGLRPRLSAEPMADSAAKAAGMKDDDVVVQVGDRSDPTAAEFQKIVEDSGGNPLTVQVEREGKIVTLQITPKEVKGSWKLGVGIGQDLTSLRFAPPAMNTPAANLDIPPDATITAIDGTKVNTWPEVYSALREKAADSNVSVTLATGGQTRDVAMKLTQAESDTLHKMLNYKLGIQLVMLTQNQHGANSGEAMLMGMDHTKKFVLQVYMTLAGLFRGTVGAENLHGIVGITKIGYDVQERGPVWLWYVLAMVSVNLAVANFLPLPIVDGGLFLLLILEKIRGKPLSLKVQSAIQVVGIVLLAGLFLFVTYNDLGMFSK